MSATRPPKNSRLLHWLCRAGIPLTGWKIVEGDAYKYPKYVLAGAHHTTNWDGFWAVTLLGYLDIGASFMIKEELAHIPLFGTLIKTLGGLPIERSKSHNLVQQMIDAFNTHDQLVIAITPEGTRRKTDYWHAGFYHIAVGAKVPIVFGFVDYKKKIAGIGPSFMPSGDVEKDLDIMRGFFSQITPRYPEKASDMRFKPKKGEE